MFGGALDVSQFFLRPMYSPLKLSGAGTVQPPEIILQGSGQLQAKKDTKPAARRLLKLKMDGESYSEFARRLGIAPQHISNYVKGTNGLGMDVLVAIAHKLTDAELVYVVKGRRIDSSDNAKAAYMKGVRDAVEEVAKTLLALSPTSSQRVDDGSAIGRVVRETDTPPAADRPQIKVSSRRGGPPK